MSREGFKMTEIGEIPKEWQIKTIEEVCDSVDYRGKTPEKVENGIFLVTAKNIGKGFINYRISKEYVSEEDYGKVMSRGLPQKGDVLLTTEAPLGNVANVDNENIALAQRVIKFRGKKGILDNYYLKHYMLGDIFQKELFAQATGSTVLGIKGSRLKKLNVVLPPLAEQTKIADILSAVDKQIDQTDALIEKTKELKKGLMQRLLTKGIGNTEFRDSEIGCIPKGWEVKSVGQIFDIYGGMPIPRSKLSDNGALYLHYGDIHKRDTNYIDTEKDSDWLPRIDESEIKKSGTKLSNGDIVFADASEDYEGIGKSVVIFNQAKEVFYSGLHTIVAKSKTDELDNNYKRYCFGTKKVRSQFRAIASGATVFGVSKTAIKDIKILVPPNEEQKKIAETLSTIDELISEYKNKSEELTSIKKSLMNKLLTGKMRVSY